MFTAACLDPNCTTCGEFWDRQLGLITDEPEDDDDRWFGFQPGDDSGF